MSQQEKKQESEQETPRMEVCDYQQAQEVGRRIAAMTPEEIKAYSEYISKKTAIPTTPERVQMVLRALPEVLKTIEQERKGEQA